MLAEPLKAYLLFDVEPAFDAADAVAARRALHGASMVVAFTSFRNAAVEGADVLLPIAPFTETSGTFVSAEGRVQSFHGVVKPRGETRPAWKVLRVLGNLLGLPGFAQETSEEVRDEALGDVATLAQRLSNRPVATVAAPPAGVAGGLERIADVPIYGSRSAGAPCALAAADGRRACTGRDPARGAVVAARPARGRARAGGAGTASVVLPARLDAAMPADVVRVPAGHPDTAALGAMFGSLTVERA